MKPVKLIKNTAERNGEKDFLLTGCERMRERLGDLYEILNSINEEELIDSVIYEIAAVNMRYHYYLRVCKERGYTA